MKKLIGRSLAALAVTGSLLGVGTANACPCVEGETRWEPGIGDISTCENGVWHHGPYGYHPGGEGS
jgi:hypothetical protein